MNRMESKLGGRKWKASLCSWRGKLVVEEGEQAKECSDFPPAGGSCQLGPYAI